MITSIQAVVVAVVQNSRGETLLLKRVHSDDYRFHGKWQLPGGGVKIGETMEQAIKRELYEETGLTPIHLQALSKVYNSIRDDFHGIIIPFSIIVENDEVKLNSENSTYKWVSLHSALNEDLLLQTKEILNLSVSLKG